VAHFSGHGLDRQNRSTGVTRKRDEGKKDKETLHWQTDHPRCRFDIKFWMGVFGGSKFQVSSKLIKWFPRCGIKICSL